MRLFLLLLCLSAPAAALAQSGPPVVAPGDLREGPQGLRMAEITPGDGPSAEEGSIARVRLRIWAESGEPLVVMTPADDPIEVQIGASGMLPGLDLGMAGIRSGESRYLYIPQDLAYGEQPPPGAPAGSLIAVIDVVAIGGSTTPAGTRPRRPPESPPKVQEFRELPSGVHVADIVEGDGPRVGQGRTLHVDYTGWTAEGHERFDSSYGRGAPFAVELGTKGVIPGWEIALRDMRVGGRRLVKIPAYLAYGSLEQGAIPAHSDLLFEIHVVRMD